MPEQNNQDTLIREVFVPNLVKSANEKLAAKGLPVIQDEKGVRDALEIADLIEKAGQNASQNTPLSKASDAVSQLRGQVNQGRGQQNQQLSPDIIKAALNSE